MEGVSGVKRKSTSDAVQNDGHGKAKKRWRPSKQDRNANSSQEREIEPGVSGIWATCAMNKEGLAVRELRGIFDQYAEKLYPDGVSLSEDISRSQQQTTSVEADIEADIQQELNGLRTVKKDSSFSSVKLDTPCLTFFQTQPPIDPVSLVRSICRDASSGSQMKTSRFIQRLTPISLTAKATESGLDEIAKSVLAPHFHGPNAKPKRFAIRPNIRNHNTLSRDRVIQQVATAVGPMHSVDLKNYDCLIIVEIYKNICGMSVVGEDFEALKRFNIQELYRQNSKSPPVEADAG